MKTVWDEVEDTLAEHSGIKFLRYADHEGYVLIGKIEEYHMSRKEKPWVILLSPVIKPPGKVAPEVMALKVGLSCTMAWFGRDIDGSRLDTHAFSAGDYVIVKIGEARAVKDASDRYYRELVIVGCTEKTYTAARKGILNTERGPLAQGDVEVEEDLEEVTALKKEDDVDLVGLV